LGCKTNGGIDLHIHSTASDGTLSPPEILTLAQKLKLQAISITDHDAIEGAAEAIHTGIPSNLNFLTGVEISVCPPNSFEETGTLHILGYGIDVHHSGLKNLLKRLREARKNRNPRIIERLNRMGISISMEDLFHNFKKGQIGRPHIARCLVQKGIMETMDDAFEKLLARGRPAYVEKFRIPCETAIQEIHHAGGLPVLAHPFLINFKNQNRLETLISTLIQMGLCGIEVYYPEHSPKEIERYNKLAQKYDLLMTGGTDFHGTNKPEIQMGVGKGNFYVPFNLYNAILNRL
jgi:predicted metal-dependent phosphoesterase TrpH